MAKEYLAVFGAGDPSSFTGLSPTFIQFRVVSSGATLTPPSISEIAAGSGFYKFSYTPTVSIAWVLDGGAALDSGSRYVRGSLDPIQAVDLQIGTVSDSFGSTSANPSTLFGYAKRAQEFQEGDAVYNKTSGVWDIYSRGSSTLLREKTLQNTTSQATKS